MATAFQLCPIICHKGGLRLNINGTHLVQAYANVMNLLREEMVNMMKKHRNFI
jgi:hypothetical protein